MDAMLHQPTINGYRTRSLLCGLWLMLLLPACSASEFTPSDTHRLVNLVRQDCGSCHGLQLTGGLGPSLLPDALEGKPTSFLVSTILAGRRGTPMPPWRGLLTEQEALWIVEHLQAGFPKE